MLSTSTSIPTPTNTPTWVVTILSEGTSIPPSTLYRPFDLYPPFDYDNELWLVSFVHDYATAVRNHEAWVNDPVVVALRFAGYPNPDGNEPDWISVFYESPTNVIVVILNDQIQDDHSIAAMEHRIELTLKEANVWEVKWAGGRYRCQPGHGQADWQPELCS